MRKKWTQTDIDFLKENYHRLSCWELEERLDRNRHAITVEAHKLGAKKFPDNISFFDDWTNESAYVIGFWAADGYVNVRKARGIRFSISQTGDKEILKSIKELVGRGTLYWIQQTGAYRYEFASPKLYQMLNVLFGHDIQCKSKILQWPAISDEYVRSFVRGYCDGDGHVGIDKRGTPQVRISSGSKAFIDSLLLEVVRLTGIKGTIHTTRLGTSLALYNSIKAICFAKWLYSDCELALARKKEIALRIARMQQSRVNRVSITPKMRALFPDILASYHIA